MTLPMGRAELFTILRGLKGAPLSVLIGVAVLGRCGTGDLELATGYNTEAVSKALRALEALGYLENHGRYQGWQLTGYAAQLPLFTPSQLNIEVGKTDLEVGKTDLPLLGGGGGLSDTRALMGDILTTTTTEREVGKTDLPHNNGRNRRTGRHSATDQPAFTPEPDVARLAEILVARAQCRRPGALTAVMTARAAGAAYDEIEVEILRWVGWYSDKNARKNGLNNPPAYILRKLSEREPAPASHVATWSADDARIHQLLGRSGGVINAQPPTAPMEDEPVCDETPAPQETAAPAPQCVEADDPATQEARIKWDIVRSQLRLQLPQSTYDTWVRDTRLLEAVDNTYRIACANAYAREWLALRLNKIVKNTLTSILGRPVTVEFVIVGVPGAN